MPRTNEDNCDCDACRFNRQMEEKQRSGVRMVSLDQIRELLEEAKAKKVKVTEEDIELAKGVSAIITSRELREDIWADHHTVKFVRLSQKERLLYSGQARMATKAEIEALL